MRQTDNSSEIFEVSGPNPAEAAALAGNNAPIGPGIITPSTPGSQTAPAPSAEEAPEADEIVFAHPESINDGMTFSEAFAAARQSMGPGAAFVWHGKVYGTYYEDEWESLTPDQQRHFAMSVYGNQDFEPDSDMAVESVAGADMVSTGVPMYDGVTDDMTFAEAFAAARNAVGQGGAFTWHGQVYGTYYENEWNSMSPTQQQEWAAAATHGSTMPVEGLDYPEIVVDDDYAAVDDLGDDNEISIVGMDTMDVDGETINLATFNVNGEPVILVDLDNDNVFDYAIGDFDNSGEVMDSENDLIDISGAQLGVNDVAAALQMQESPDPMFTMPSDMDIADAGVTDLDLPADV